MPRTVRLAAVALVATGVLATPAMAHPDPPCSFHKPGVTIEGNTITIDRPYFVC